MELARRTLVLLLLYFFSSFSLGESLESRRQEPISLYDFNNDFVVELTDANLTSTVYKSNKMWVVEFYAHWCGHCQKFASAWKKLADEFQGWRDLVQIAAINCAENQICGDFHIQGTPTIRIFYPKIDSGIGTEIRPVFNTQLLRESIYPAIEKAQQYNLLPKPLQRNLVFQRSYQSLKKLAIITKRGQKLVLILENMGAQTFGMDVIFWGASQLPHFHIIRVDGLSSEIFHLNPHGQLPAVLIADNVTRFLNSEVSTVFYPVQDQFTTLSQSVISFLKTLPVEVVPPYSDKDLPWTVDTSTSISTTTTEGYQSLSPVRPDEAEDQVDIGDLEKAIQYSLQREIPTHSQLSEANMSTIYQFLDLIVKHLPLRRHFLLFLMALREWPVIMGYDTLSGKEFEDKVVQLSEFYKAFEEIPQEYRRCLGSKPHLRGYPCSLWTLFHTLTVNAAIYEDQRDSPPSNMSTVAKVVMSYIDQFFSCRHCASNFKEKVAQLDLPTSAHQSVMWLWKIHNMANLALAGDVTEDPLHPKQLWPSEALCPKCRLNGFENDSVEEVIWASNQLWNATQVYSYLLSVYGADNLKRTADQDIEPPTLESKLEEVMLKLYKDLKGKVISLQNETISMDLDLETLVTINRYCAKVNSLTKLP